MIYVPISIIIIFCLVSINVSEVLSFEIPLTDPPVIKPSNLEMGLKVRIKTEPFVFLSTYFTEGHMSIMAFQILTFSFRA